MHLFYLPDLDAPVVQFDEDESKHVVRVLRLKNGDTVQLTDGRGNLCVARISDDHPKRCRLDIESKTFREPQQPYRFHLAVAPTKNMDRMEWLLEKAVEIGLHRFSLLECEHSERAQVKPERLEKIAIAAMKQSQQSWLPVIDPICDFNAFIAAHASFAGNACIAHCGNGERKPFKTVTAKNTLLLIGPEGDFSPAEVTLALQHNFHAVSLGDTRLRTETAALAGCMTVNIQQA
jgi:16S rRNA (uracil1498-N3)-methyltransferase